MANPTPAMQQAVANIEAAIRGEQEKSFRYRDLNEEEIMFFQDRVHVNFSNYEWRINPQSLLHENRRAIKSNESALTETELKLLPHFIDTILQQRDTLAVSLDKKNAKGAQHFTIEIENPITKTKMLFEAAAKNSSKKSINKQKAPRLNLRSAKMLISPKSAGLAPASTSQSTPSPENKLSNSDFFDLYLALYKAY